MNEQVWMLHDFVLDVWHSLGLFERLALRAVITGLGFFVFFWAIESACRSWSPANYRPRSFLQDAAYWFYYRCGLHRLLFLSWTLLLLEPPPVFLNMHLARNWPIWLQVVVFLLYGDFISYWLHRAQHRWKLLWAFHSTHHSQERLNFMTTARHHPVEDFLKDCVFYVPLVLLGTSPAALGVVGLISSAHTYAQHTQIPWRLGPFYKILCTPSFHAYHHSRDPAHFNRNFAPTFSFWDYLFGTAVPDSAPAPVAFGLDDVKSASFLESLITPFYLLRKFYAPRVDAVAEH